MANRYCGLAPKAWVAWIGWRAAFSTRCHLFAFDGLELDADGCAHFDPILDFFSFGPGIVCITALWAHRWRRRSHGSVGLGILLAVPLVLAQPWAQTFLEASGATLVARRVYDVHLLFIGPTPL